MVYWSQPLPSLGNSSGFLGVFVHNTLLGRARGWQTRNRGIFFAFVAITRKSAEAYGEASQRDSFEIKPTLALEPSGSG